jgi:hypothetical protein
LTVAGFAVGYSLEVEDGVAAHPKTNVFVCFVVVCLIDLPTY